MEILRARTAGFCMGVGLALRKLDEALAAHQGEGRLVMLGPIIHNPQVLADYAKRGVLCVDSPEGIRAGDTALIRAHGIPRDVESRLRALGAEVLDATCPRVKEAQLAIDRATRSRRSLYLFGEAEHPEVRGLISYANGPCHVFGSLRELEADLPFMGQDEVVLAAQTTQAREEFEAIRKRLEEDHALTVLGTICDATRKRQEEAQAISRHVEAMIVVGGKSSGNTRRLADVARSCGIPVRHIESPEELRLEDMGDCGKIGLTAGASTPKRIIDAVERKLRVR